MGKAADAITSVTAYPFYASMDSQRLGSLQNALRAHTGPAWSSTGKSDLLIRCESLIDSAVTIVIAYVKGLVVDVLEWKEQATKTVFHVWNETFKSFVADPHTVYLLGNGSRVLYQFVRRGLGVPFHQALVEHPTIENDELDGRPKKTVGGWISIIYDNIKSDLLYDGLVAVAEEGLLDIANGH